MWILKQVDKGVFALNLQKHKLNKPIFYERNF